MSVVERMPRSFNSRQCLSRNPSPCICPINDFAPTGQLHPTPNSSWKSYYDFPFPQLGPSEASIGRTWNLPVTTRPSRRLRNPTCPRRKPETSGSRSSSALLWDVVITVMVMGLVPWPTVDGNLIAGNDDFPQHLAAVCCLVCGVVVCTVGEVRAVVNDDVLTVGIQFGQNTFLSMLMICAVPFVMVRAIVVAMAFHLCAIFHQAFGSEIGVGIHSLAAAGRRGGGRIRVVVAISRIEIRKTDVYGFARIGGWTLGAARREVPCDVPGRIERWIISHGASSIRYDFTGLRRSSGEVA